MVFHAFSRDATPKYFSPLELKNTRSFHISKNPDPKTPLFTKKNSSELKRPNGYFFNLACFSRNSWVIKLILFACKQANKFVVKWFLKKLFLCHCIRWSECNIDAYTIKRIRIRSKCLVRMLLRFLLFTQLLHCYCAQQTAYKYWRNDSTLTFKNNWASESAKQRT
jgi:hypothetical protein